MIVKLIIPFEEKITKFVLKFTWKASITLKNYSWEKHTAQLLGVYREILEET